MTHSAQSLCYIWLWRRRFDSHPVQIFVRTADSFQIGFGFFYVCKNTLHHDKMIYLKTEGGCVFIF